MPSIEDLIEAYREQYLGQWPFLQPAYFRAWDDLRQYAPDAVDQALHRGLRQGSAKDSSKPPVYAEILTWVEIEQRRIDGPRGSNQTPQEELVQIWGGGPCYTQDQVRRGEEFLRRIERQRADEVESQADPDGSQEEQPKGAEEETGSSKKKEKGHEKTEPDKDAGQTKRTWPPVESGPERESGGASEG